MNIFKVDQWFPIFLLYWVKFLFASDVGKREQRIKKDFKIFQTEALFNDLRYACKLVLKDWPKIDSIKKMKIELKLIQLVGILQIYIIMHLVIIQCSSPPKIS